MDTDTLIALFAAQFAQAGPDGIVRVPLVWPISLAVGLVLYVVVYYVWRFLYFSRHGADLSKPIGYSSYEDDSAALESAEAELSQLRNNVESVIDDLNRARANGTVYTYGNIQFRLRHALTQSTGKSNSARKLLSGKAGKLLLITRKDQQCRSKLK